jgi:hypothetical protein
LYKPLHVEGEYAKILQQLARLATFQGDVQTANDYNVRALKIIEALELEAELGVALRTVSQNLTNIGDYHAALDYGERAIQVCRRIGYASMIPLTLAVMGNCEIFMERFAEARRHYDEALRLAREINAPITVVNALIGLGRVEIGENRGAEHMGIEKAMRCWREGLEIAQRQNMPMSRFELLQLMAEAHLQVDNLEAARALLGEFAEIGLTFNSDYHSAQMILTGTRFAARTERVDQAARWAGLLTKYERYFAGQGFNRLCAELEAALGDEVYKHLAAEGESLDLSTVRSEVAKLLDTSGLEKVMDG